MTSVFAINAVITILMGVLPFVIQDEQAAYYTELALTIIYGSVLAILQATLYGEAGPSQISMSNLMVGTGFSGLLMNFLRIVFLASVSSYATGALIFFILSGAYLIICAIISYHYIRNKIKL